jgi:hypothetical protein
MQTLRFLRLAETAMPGDPLASFGNWCKGQGQSNRHYVFNTTERQDQSGYVGTQTLQAETGRTSLIFCFGSAAAHNHRQQVAKSRRTAIGASNVSTYAE